LNFLNLMYLYPHLLTLPTHFQTMETKRRSPGNPVFKAAKKLCKLCKDPADVLSRIAPNQAPIQNSRMGELKERIDHTVRVLFDISIRATQIEHDRRKEEQDRQKEECAIQKKEKARKKKERARQKKEKRARWEARKARRDALNKAVDEERKRVLEATVSAQESATLSIALQNLAQQQDCEHIRHKLELARIKAIQHGRKEVERIRNAAKAAKERAKSEEAIEYANKLPKASDNRSYSGVYGREPGKMRSTSLSSQILLVTAPLIVYLSGGAPVESAHVDKVRNALYTIMRRFENTATTSIVCVAARQRYKITWAEVPDVKEKFLNMC
jgi:hypothetical protein